MRYPSMKKRSCLVAPDVGRVAWLNGCPASGVLHDRYHDERIVLVVEFVFLNICAENIFCLLKYFICWDLAKKLLALVV